MKKSDRGKENPSMAQTENKSIPESVIDIACVIVSWLILLFLPSEEGFFLYAMIGVSAFLFIVGFFRYMNASDRFNDPKNEIPFAALMTAGGIVMNVCGCRKILSDQGSAGSIMFAALLLIESLVLYGLAFGALKTPGMKWGATIALRIAAVLLVIFGIWYGWMKGFDQSSVIFGVMLLIQAIVFWAMGAGNDPFNREMTERCGVQGMKASPDELQREFAKTKTQLGTPWLAEIKTVPGKAIVYGPTEDHYFVYGCWYPGKFMVLDSDEPIFRNPEEAAGHIVRETANEDGVLLDRENLPEAYAQMFRRFQESGVRKWEIHLSHKPKKKNR